VIAKVPSKRRDGRSSFNALTSYLLRNASAVMHGDSTFSIKTAGLEMAQVARMNERVKNAAYHFVLSWPSGESPTDQEAEGAMRSAISALGMSKHQWVGAVHRNTAHTHVHVAVNRVHPVTFKAVNPFRDWITLDKVCREIELEQGWKHDPGPAIVRVADDGSRSVELGDRKRERSSPARPATKARDYSAHTGTASFQEWVAGEPAKRLKRLLERPGCSWSHVHRELAKFGLEYRPKGSGAIVVDKMQPDKWCAKATHIGRFASRTQLERKLGPLDPPRGRLAELNPARADVDEYRRSIGQAAPRLGVGDTSRDSERPERAETALHKSWSGPRSYSKTIGHRHHARATARSFMSRRSGRPERETVVVRDARDSKVREALLKARQRWGDRLYVVGTRRFLSAANRISSELGIRLKASRARHQRPGLTRTRSAHERSDKRPRLSRQSEHEL
jgi:hypothetical protein